MRFLDLRRTIVSLVDLPSFVAEEAGVSVDIQDGDRAKCVCPLHGDSNPSFSMIKHEDGWGYHCFGCQSSGTVVEFYKAYYDIEDTGVAMEMICEKIGLEDEVEMVKRAIDNMANVDSQLDKEIEELHIMASYRCQSIARGTDDDEHIRWVNNAYREMNAALGSRDYAVIEMICDRAVEILDEFVYK